MYYRGEPQEIPSTEAETEAQMSPMIEPKTSEDSGGKAQGHAFLALDFPIGRSWEVGTL